MLDALTLDQLRVFVAVAEAGSFRGGALRVARVQSAVSHAIGTLEAALGLRLFDRSAHRPSLTAEGRALLADARAILLKVDAMRARAHGLCEGVEPTIALALDTLFPMAAVAQALHEMHAAYPSVAARVWAAPLGGPVLALREKRCTLGIVVGEDFRDPQLELDALAVTEIVAVAAAGSALARRAEEVTPLSRRELADHVQIVLEDPTPLSEGRDFGVLSPGTWRVGSQDAKHALILAGLGWGRLPRWLAARDLAEGRLVRLNAPALGPGGVASVQTFLAHRSDAPLGAAARAFRAALLRSSAPPDGATTPSRPRAPRRLVRGGRAAPG